MEDKRVYVLLFLLGLVLSCEAISCRDGAVERNGSCYKLYTDAKNFEDANAMCRAAPGGGHLISIDSEEVQEFVKKQMEGENVEELWVGASRQTTDWRWVETDSYMKYQGCFRDKDDARLDVFIGSSANYTPDACIEECRSRDLMYAGVKRDSDDGTKVVCRCGNTYRPDTYLVNTGCNFVCPADSDQKCGNIDVMRIYSVKYDGVNGWVKDQPNNKQYYQACLAMHKGDHYKWGDEQCHGGMEQYGYVCQYDEPSCSHTIAAGKCYSVHGKSSMSWYKARYLCKEKGGDMLQVDTKEFFDFLNAGSAQLDATVNRWWIGGARERWQWADGKEMIFTNWAIDRPNSVSKACAIVGSDVGHSYEWEDKPCSDVAAFICLQQELMTTTMPTTAQPTTDAPDTTPAKAQTTTESDMDTTATPATTAASKPDATTASSTRAKPTVSATSKTTAKETTSAKSTTTTTKPTTTATTKPTTKPTATTTTKPTMKSTTAHKTATALPDITSTQSTVEATTSSNPVAAKNTHNQSIFTTGVVIGIVIAAVFVLFAFIRLLVYCVGKSDDSSTKNMPFDLGNQQKSDTLESFNDPYYKSTMDQSESNGSIGNPLYDV